jgi:hypothetical protein
MLLSRLAARLAPRPGAEPRPRDGHPVDRCWSGSEESPRRPPPLALRSRSTAADELADVDDVRPRLTGDAIGPGVSRRLNQADDALSTRSPTDVASADARDDPRPGWAGSPEGSPTSRALGPRPGAEPLPRNGHPVGRCWSGTGGSGRRRWISPGPRPRSRGEARRSGSESRTRSALTWRDESPPPRSSRLPNGARAKTLSAAAEPSTRAPARGGDGVTTNAKTKLSHPHSAEAALSTPFAWPSRLVAASAECD